MEILIKISLVKVLLLAHIICQHPNKTKFLPPHTTSSPLRAKYVFPNILYQQLNSIPGFMNSLKLLSVVFIVII